MNEMNDFLAFTADTHDAEIKRTRVGGLGGSDAAIIERIGTHGLAALTATDNKRLAVMLGLEDPNDWKGNAYTQAGHMFEDFVEPHISDAVGEFVATKGEDLDGWQIEREAVLTRPLAKSFKVLAHADYMTKNRRRVLECKYATTKSTDQVAAEYSAQLQWYYMLGTECVFLIHGTGSVEPFEPSEITPVKIARDEAMIATLENGLRILDEAIGAGWTPKTASKTDVIECPAHVQNAFEVLGKVKADAAECKRLEDAAKKVVREYLEETGLASVTGDLMDGTTHTATLAAGRTSKTFDQKAFAAKIAEKYADRLDLLDEIQSIIDECTKTTQGAPVITFK